jgi:predicted RNA-binding Zn ribbon-like protein
MTGEGPLVVIAGLQEGVLVRERDLPQPGHRPPAPAELVLLQSFLNTHFDLVGEWGADLLAGPERLLEWFSRRGLVAETARAPGRAQAGRILAVREGFRELARRNRDPEAATDPDVLAQMDEAVAGVALGLGLSPERLVLSARDRGGFDGALGTLLAIGARAMIDGRWQRLKTCPGEHCGWVFYDHSRNNSGRWCSMAVCGGRTKARAHYRRRLRGDGSVSP